MVLRPQLKVGLSIRLGSVSVNSAKLQEFLDCLNDSALCVNEGKSYGLSTRCSHENASFTIEEPCNIVPVHDPVSYDRGHIR